MTRNVGWRFGVSDEDSNRPQFIAVIDSFSTVTSTPFAIQAASSGSQVYVTLKFAACDLQFYSANSISPGRQVFL